jgi:hypothetical protein
MFFLEKLPGQKRRAAGDYFFNKAGPYKNLKRPGD